MKFYYEYKDIYIDHKFGEQAFELQWYYKNRNLDSFIKQFINDIHYNDNGFLPDEIYDEVRVTYRKAEYICLNFLRTQSYMTDLSDILSRWDEIYEPNIFFMDSKAISNFKKFLSGKSNAYYLSNQNIPMDPVVTIFCYIYCFIENRLNQSLEEYELEDYMDRIQLLLGQLFCVNCMEILYPIVDYLNENRLLPIKDRPLQIILSELEFAKGDIETANQIGDRLFGELKVDLSSLEQRALSSNPELAVPVPYISNDQPLPI